MKTVSKLRRPLTEKTASPNFANFRPSSAKASRHLASIKSTDSKAERLLRSALWRRGLRFRKNVKTLPGKPDLVFSREQLVVFCDGDFWHGRNWNREKSRLSKGPNAAYWIAKIARNKQRDAERRRVLSNMGWRIMRFWESDIIADPEAIANRIVDALRKPK